MAAHPVRGLRNKLLAMLAFAAWQPGLSQGADLILRTDVECRLTVDGKTQGMLNPNQSLRLQLSADEHRIEAVDSAGGGTWQKTIALAMADSQQELTISLRPSRDYWIDSATKLIWTAADNGSGLSWGQALRYCRELTLAGFKDWKLPSIDDLQGLFDKTRNQGGYRGKGPIRLTGWHWSATPGAQAGEGGALDFDDGGRASVAAGDAGLNRALCVHRPENRSYTTH
jgi:hypothetical protein